MTEKQVYYAHSANAAGQWQPLKDHLRNVAALASRFAEAASPGVMKDMAIKDYYKKSPPVRCH